MGWKRNKESGAGRAEEGFSLLPLAGLALAGLALALALFAGGGNEGKDTEAGQSAFSVEESHVAAGALPESAPAFWPIPGPSFSSGFVPEGRLPAQALPPGWALTLVNDKNPLPDDFTPLTRAISGYDDRRFDARAARDLEELLSAAEKDGCKLYLVSAYRSVSRQDALFRRKTAVYKNQGYGEEAAQSLAARLVARPGCSEHNLGLAADIVSANWYAGHSDLTQAFDQTPEFAWLSVHGARYGFILRYPAGKEALTGVSYEPWHYRYVGREAAVEMAAMGLCLEEYLSG